MSASYILYGHAEILISKSSMQRGFKGADMKERAVTGVIKMWYSLSLFDIFGCALLSRCVCIFPFHASHGQTDWHESQARLVISLFEFDCLFPLSGGSQITTHVALSVIASRLQGNSLSSSRRPSICSCPFVSSSIHRSEKDSRLWRFLFLVFSPYVWPCEAWLSRHMSTCSLLLSVHLRIVVMIRMDASTHVRRWGRGSAGAWRAHATAPQPRNQWWHWCLIKGCFELSGVSFEWNSGFWLRKGRSLRRLVSEGASELSLTKSCFPFFPETNQCWRDNQARWFCCVQG